MNVCILNGSPKGKHSVSLQSMNYLSKKFPQHNYSIFHVSKTIKKLESDENEFSLIIDQIESSDLVMWVTPVYTLLIPSQLKRFIELINERKKESVFKNKFFGIIHTSIGFFDHCAMNYLKEVSEDLEMKFIGGFSADSYDLLNENEEERLFKFGKILFKNLESSNSFSKFSKKIEFKPDKFIKKETGVAAEIKDKQIIILKDREYKNENISEMTKYFESIIKGSVKTMNLEDIDIKGGCTGCVQCGFDHQCMYENVDGFTKFYDNFVKEADIIIIAGEIKDRWLSSKWKEFLDRSFFHNHVPMLKGKQIGFMISGSLSENHSLRHFFESFSQFQRVNLVDIICDECADITASSIENFAKTLSYMAAEDYISPSGFLGKAGHKIFRDDIWGRHRFVFQKDHEWYENNGFYDFPQDDKFSIEMSENMIKLTSDPEMRANIRKMLKTEMVKPHLKIVEKA